MIGFRFVINCDNCDTISTVEVTEYLLYFIHKYIFFMNIGLYCDECL